MKKYAMLSIFLAFAVPVSAQPKLKGWQFIGETESGVTQYIDMDTLKRERGYMRVREMNDRKSPVWSVSSKRILSEIDDQYIDCANRRLAILRTTTYECRMARCSPKEDYSYELEPLEFKIIPRQESLASNLFYLVCQK